MRKKINRLYLKWISFLPFVFTILTVGFFVLPKLFGPAVLFFFLFQAIFAAVFLVSEKGRVDQSDARKQIQNVDIRIRRSNADYLFAFIASGLAIGLIFTYYDFIFMLPSQLRSVDYLLIVSALLSIQAALYFLKLPSVFSLLKHRSDPK